ncbi:MAG: hypothetical protein A2007_03525 [Verrucomicrobia bacterium GWC2_42_7]|nr:MAG: hypothetical protein A2007_03525 [Verrucomicrobia bacterium GWC2_42_7]
MAEVFRIFVDGEDVVFSGNVPENLATFVTIIFDLIEQQKRYVVSFLVDGKPLHNSMLEKKLDAFREIVITTAAQREFFLKLIDQQVTFFETLPRQPELNYLPILSRPFSEFVPKIDSFLLQIAPILETLQSFRDFAEKHTPDWSEPLSKLQSDIDGSIEAFLNFSKNKDVGMVAEVIGFRLVPQLISSLDFLKKTIKPYFEALP